MNFMSNYILVFSLLLFYTKAQVIKFDAKFDTFDNQSFKQVKAFEDEFKTFNVSLTFSTVNESLKDEKLFLNCWMDYQPVGIIVNWTDMVLKTGVMPISPIQFSVTLFAKRLGGSNLLCSIINEGTSTKFSEERVAQFIVSRPITIHEMIFRVLITVFVIFLTFVMGCGLDTRIIFGYFKKPITPFIGFCSQFIFMPLISSALAKFSGISKEFGLGLLVIGCSPGGGASNFWTAVFEGDLNLSMTMTFISSFAALFMMPLWLFLLGRLFINPRNVKIPYGNIALNLLLILVPASLGIAFQWKWKKTASLLMKKLKLMVLLLVIFILTYGTYANLYIYKLMGDYIYLLPIGAMLPWLGFLFGFIFSLITRRNKAQLIAISLETGFQNIGIAILILMYSMPQPDGDMGVTMPLVVAIFTPLPLYIAFVGMMIKKKCCGPPKTEVDVEMKLPTDGHKDMLINDEPKNERDNN